MAGKAKTLATQDLGQVLNELYTVRAKWFNIGLELAVSVADLQRIESEYKNDHSTCLRQMLLKWLESGNANWKLLCDALQRPIVLGEDTALATNLKEKYCKEESEASKPKKRKAPPAVAVACGQAPKRPKTGVVVPENLDPNDFKKMPKQLQDRLCVNCKTVPYNPQRSECCNLVYCFTCSLEELLCPTHREKIVFVADKLLKKAVARMTIKCPNWKTGCTYEENISKVYKQHLPECTGCAPSSDNNPVHDIPHEPATPTEPAPPTRPTAPSGNTTTVKTEPPATTAHTPEEICCIYAKQGCLWRGELGSLTEHIGECKISRGDSTRPKEKKAPPPTATHHHLPSRPAQTAAKLAQTKPTQVPVKREPAPPPPNQLQGITVCCVYQQKGCTWTGSVEQLTLHMQSCEKGKLGTSASGASRAGAANRGSGVSHPHIKTEPTEAAAQPTLTFGALARNQLRSTPAPTPIPCKYYEAIGCPHSVLPDQMYAHLQSGMQTHLDLAISKIAELQRRLN